MIKKDDILGMLRLGWHFRIEQKKTTSHKILKIFLLFSQTQFLEMVVLIL